MSHRLNKELNLHAKPSSLFNILIHPNPGDWCSLFSGYLPSYCFISRTHHPPKWNTILDVGNGKVGSEVLTYLHSLDKWGEGDQPGKEEPGLGLGAKTPTAAPCQTLL